MHTSTQSKTLVFFTYVLLLFTPICFAAYPDPEESQQNVQNYSCGINFFQEQGARFSQIATPDINSIASQPVNPNAEPDEEIDILDQLVQLLDNQVNYATPSMQAVPNNAPQSGKASRTRKKSGPKKPYAFAIQCAICADLVTYNMTSIPTHYRQFHATTIEVADPENAPLYRAWTTTLTIPREHFTHHYNTYNCRYPGCAFISRNAPYFAQHYNTTHRSKEQTIQAYRELIAPKTLGFIIRRRIQNIKP